MMSTWIEVIIVLVLILLNGLFAMYELAMVSSRKTRLEQKGDEGQSGAKTALKMLETPNRFLSTVQVGISLIGILSGAFGGARLALPLANLFHRIGWFGGSADGVALVIVVLLITYFSLVLGELLPKQVALNNPEAVAIRLSGFMKTLSKITRPIVNLLTASTGLGMELLGIKPSPEPVVTEEEIKLLIEEGRETGIFEQAEEEMVSGVFRLGGRRVDALMTPRTGVVWIDIEDDHDSIVHELMSSEYSRIPVARGDLDEVLGMVNVKELIGVDIKSADFKVEEHIREPLFVPENMPALKAFEQFRSSGIHQALVIDEYGGVQGMVTLYDVLEAIVGDIPLDANDQDQDAVQRADGSWLFDGLIAIDELKEILDVDALPDEDRAGFQTLSGFVMNQLGSIPKVGQAFEWDIYRFEVVDMDGRRVDRVLVEQIPRQAQVPGQ
ncbi:MAG: hemolysin family protein [Anaerolineaceae bacterium]